MRTDDVVKLVSSKIGDIPSRYPLPEPESAVPNKYLHLKTWIEANVRRAKALRLESAKRSRILDIGSGVGYFAFIAQQLGHDSIGIDHPKRPKLYREMTDALGIRVQDFVVEPMIDLPQLGKFDIITAHMVTFNIYRLSEPWGLAEWRHFVDNATSMLRSGGRLCLELNREVDSGQCYSPELERFFIERGAFISGAHPHRPEPGGHRLVFSR